MLRYAVQLAILLALLASACTGATITVYRDGTGDHSVLQSALDAAADGDTILIGPGEFVETTIIHPPGWTGDLEVYGEIRQQVLTIIGSGAGITIVGPPVCAPNYQTESPEGLATDTPKERITITDLTVRNCYKGIAVSCDLKLERCHVENNLFGLSWTAQGSGGTVRDCRFVTTDALQPLGLYVRGVAGVLVEDCEFVRASPYVDNSAAIFRRCIMAGPDVVGFQLASGVCQLWDCHIAGVQVGLTTGYVGSRCEIYESEIQGTFCAIDAEYRTSVYVVNSALSGGTDSAVYSYGADEITIHGSDFERGSGPVVHCIRNCVSGPVSYDLTDNYWGTASESQIQEWIIDSIDDPGVCATVLYSPFAGQSVPAETTSWGDLKASFR